MVCSALSQVSNRLENLLTAAEAGGEVEEGLDDLRRSHLDLAADMGVDADETLTDLFRAAGHPGGHPPDPGGHAPAAGPGDVGRRAALHPPRRHLAPGAGDRRLLDRRPGAAGGRAGADGVPRAPVPLRHLRPRLRRRSRPTPATRAGAGGGDPGLPGPAAQRRHRAPRPRRLGHGGRLPGGQARRPPPGDLDRRAGPLHRQPAATSPDARLLLHMGYAEAGELAAKGAKVLHPRCIRPAQDHDIPIHIRSTPSPRDVGTVISSAARGRRRCGRSRTQGDRADLRWTSTATGRGSA